MNMFCVTVTTIIHVSVILPPVFWWHIFLLFLLQFPFQSKPQFMVKSQKAFRIYTHWQIQTETVIQTHICMQLCAYDISHSKAKRFKRHTITSKLTNRSQTSSPLAAALNESIQIGFCVVLDGFYAFISCIIFYRFAVVRKKFFARNVRYFCEKYLYKFLILFFHFKF